MTIKAVIMLQNGFMTQPFAMGGEDGPDKFDPSVKYRSSLQNYLIDTGKEVILVDTGVPAEMPEQIPDESTQIYMGVWSRHYLDALADLGYEPEQITKILITHKHADHTGELRRFPNAVIYASPEEAKAQELSIYPNVVPAAFQDGPYHSFEASEKIAEGVYYIPARGHTTGNSIVIVEDGGLYYMIHGDVTYTDEALYENKLSVVFEDPAAARDTLDRVRAFIRENPTVYLSTHTPLGYENLEAKRVVDLDHPPKSIPPEMPAGRKAATGKYVCSVCGFVYDPAVGDPKHGIPAGTKFEDLPEDWHCPRCRQSKDQYNKA